MTALLEGNPFAAKLRAEELEEKLNEETERLQALEPQEVAEPSEVWEKLEEELKKALETAEVETGEHVWENASVGEISERIAHFLEKGLVGKALGLLGDAQKKMPEEKMFKLTNTEDEVHEEEEQEKDDDDEEVIMTLLRKDWIYSGISSLNPRKLRSPVCPSRSTTTWTS